MNEKDLQSPTAEIDQCLDAQRVLVTVIKILQIKNITVKERRTESWHDSDSANIEFDHDLTLDIRPLQDVINTFCMNANAYYRTKHTKVNKPQEFIRKKAAQPSSSSERNNSTSLAHQYQEEATRSRHERSDHTGRIRRGHQLLDPEKSTQCCFSVIIQNRCVPSEDVDFTIKFSAYDKLDDHGAEIMQKTGITASSLSLVNIADPHFLRKFLEIRTWENVTSLSIQAGKPMTVDLGWLHEFPNLRNLSLQSFNRISNTGWKHVDKLESIEFQSLETSVLWATKVLDKMDGLRYFSLKDTPITNLNSSVFDGAPNIENISIIQTAIEEIEHGTFNKLTNLRSLIISDGKILDLPPQLFIQQDELTRLSLNNNRLTRLMNSDFQGLDQLESLDLSQNRISSIEKNTFAPLHRLTKLFLDGNRLATLNASLTTGLLDSSVLDHSSLHGLQRNLIVLWVSSNFRLEMTDDLFLYLPNIEEVVMSDCHISKMPQLIHLNHLRSLFIWNHDIDVIELSTSVPFKNLQFLSISRKPDNSPVKVTWGQNETKFLPEMLRLFDAQNADVNGLGEIFHKLNLSSLEIIILGWKEMNEITFNMSNLCDALPTHIPYFEIQASSYKHLKLCSGKDFEHLILSNNKFLETLDIPGCSRQVNVSGCSNLQTLSVAEVDVLDISRTMLFPSE
eukprot:gene5151-8787_t